MTEDQADQIIDFICGILRPPDPVETRKAWRIQLAVLDADIASQAVINGAQVWDFFPSWPQFYTEYRALKPAPQAQALGCRTCGGDKFVLVALRKPQTTDWMKKHKLEAKEDQHIEEMAPCPDCNSGADTSFWRHDGTEAQGLDTARIRQMMDS